MTMGADGDGRHDEQMDVPKNSISMLGGDGKPFG
jgi:hypothetical protein